jgi:hypothetical protein
MRWDFAHISLTRVDIPLHSSPQKRSPGLKTERCAHTRVRTRIWISTLVRLIWAKSHLIALPTPRPTAHPPLTLQLNVPPKTSPGANLSSTPDITGGRSTPRPRQHPHVEHGCRSSCCSQNFGLNQPGDASHCPWQWPYASCTTVCGPLHVLCHMRGGAATRCFVCWQYGKTCHSGTSPSCA